MDSNEDLDYGPQLNALMWLLIAIAGLFLFTRLYLKSCQNRGLWWDDWILLASWTALTIQAGLTAYLISLGYGRRRIPLANLPYFGLPVNILSTLLIIANLWGKTSFALTLLRIPVPWLRAGVWFTLVSLTVFLTASVVFVWIECGPLKMPGNICVPVDLSIRYNVFSCAYSAFADVVLAILPWKHLFGLEMSRKEKIGTMVAMSMGMIAGATATAKSTTITRIKGSDPRGSIPLLALGNAEAAVCIMAASIPILRALARDSFRPVPRGYPTSMAGSGPRASTRPLSQAVSLSCSTQPPPTSSLHGRSTRVPPIPSDKAQVPGLEGAANQKADDTQRDEDHTEMDDCSQ